MKRIKQVYTALREQSCVSYAKIAMIGRFCDVDLLVIRATSPDDFPVSEKYVHDLLRIFSSSPSSIRIFALSFTRRFGNTHSWRVALKCLFLLHRLIRSLPENCLFRSDLLWVRSNGLISLFPCRFRDNSSSNSHEFTSFIRAYARLLDEALDCLPANFKSLKVEKLSDNFADGMKELGRLLDVLPQLQSLLDRVIDCKPVGSVYQSFLVRTVMKQIVRDSFVCYTDFRRDSVFLLENLFQMPYRNCISAFGIYKRSAIQATELDEFYEICKQMGLCGSYEYPHIDQIPGLHVQALESFLSGMWQLTDSSSSESSSSPFSSTDDSDKQLVRLETMVSTEWEKFEDEEERDPLIQLDFNENISWETLLEASVGYGGVPRDHVFFQSTAGYDPRFENQYGYQYKCDDHHQNDGLQMQVYSHNPFHHPWTGTNYNGVCASQPNSPWNEHFL
ncbi:Clathrin coat assembly protein [Thalictrum thalictroides]|uniref:Clathrin coat assembly protein n=1 Tax=Thalictrum thalictroides TaxID=46969 RepID=A0A7J6VUU4_THATH|nr:Clathrin coat assembly protein [Thalictrum thalictroides]